MSQVRRYAFGALALVSLAIVVGVSRLERGTQVPAARDPIEKRMEKPTKVPVIGSESQMEGNEQESSGTPGWTAQVRTHEGRTVVGARVTVKRRSPRLRGRKDNPWTRQTMTSNSRGRIGARRGPASRDLVVLEAEGMPRTAIPGHRAWSGLAFAEPGFVRGMVQRAGDGAHPITVRATVSRYGRWDRHVLTTTAASDGSYKIGPIAIGSLLQVRAECPGYIPVVGVAARLRYRTMEVDLELKPGRTLRGTILDESGVEVSGALVRTIQGESQQETRSDEAGRFALSGLETEAAMVVVRTETHAMKIVSNVEPGSEVVIRLKR